MVRRVDVGTTYGTSEEMSYGLAAKCHVDVSEDGLLAIDARASAEVTGRAFGSAVARMSGGGVASGSRGPSGGRKLGGGGGGGRSGGGSGGDVAAGAKQFISAVQLAGRVELTQIILGFNVRAYLAPHLDSGGFSSCHVICLVADCARFCVRRGRKT